MVCATSRPLKSPASTLSDSWPMRGPFGGAPRNLSSRTPSSSVSSGPSTWISRSSPSKKAKASSSPNARRRNSICRRPFHTARAPFQARKYWFIFASGTASRSSSSPVMIVSPPTTRDGPSISSSGIIAPFASLAGRFTRPLW